MYYARNLYARIGQLPVAMRIPAGGIATTRPNPFERLGTPPPPPPPTWPQDPPLPALPVVDSRTAYDEWMQIQTSPYYSWRLGYERRYREALARDLALPGIMPSSPMSVWIASAFRGRPTHYGLVKLGVFEDSQGGQAILSLLSTVAGGESGGPSILAIGPAAGGPTAWAPPSAPLFPPAVPPAVAGLPGRRW